MAQRKSEPPYRVGTGFDLHRLVPGRPFLLGGVEIPFGRGPLGHSDGDPLLHALADALLGAAGLDDLGTLFPDSDPANKDAPGSDLLRRVREKVEGAGFRVANVDAVVIAEAPKIGPHRDRIRQRVGELLGIPADRVNLKGKTAEKLGPLGNGDAVAVLATAMLES